jgi:hypothetical protein
MYVCMYVCMYVYVCMYAGMETRETELVAICNV